MDTTLIFWGVLGVVTLWCIVLTFLYIKQQQFFSKFTVGISRKDLKTLLEHIDAKTTKQQKDLDLVQRDVRQQGEHARKHLQRYAMVRFNPFDDTGGDQSFSLSLLNADGEGFVVTSLHSRDATRIYAKDVRAGGKKSELSKEELEALAQAMKGHA